MNKLSKETTICYLFLILIIFFHGAMNCIWLKGNMLAPFWDESIHLTIALRYIRSFPDIFIYKENFPISENVNLYSAIYSPFFYLSATLFSLVWGNSQFSLTLTNLFYMVVLLFSTFKIGEKLFDKKVGLLSAFILSFYPIIFGTSRMFLLDYALTSMVALSIYLLIQTNFFRDTKFVIFFSLSVVTGTLIKIYFSFFLIGPLMYICFKNIKEKNFPNSKINYMIFFAIGIILPLLWYRVNSTPITGRFSQLIDGLEYGYTYYKSIFLIIVFLPILLIVIKLFFRKLFSKFFNVKVFLGVFFSFLILTFILYIIGRQKDTINILPLVIYIRHFLKGQAGIFLGLIFICSVYYFLFKKEPQNNWALLAGWIVIPYMLFSLSRFLFWDNMRFTMPYLPAVAIISACWVIENRRLFWIKIFSCLLIALGVFYFFILSFGTIFYTAESNQPIVYYSQIDKANTLQRIFLPNIASFWLVHPMDKSNWRIKEVLEWIAKDANKKEATIGLLVDTDCINNETFTYYTYANRFPFKIVRCVDEIKEECFNLDYLITVSNPISWHWYERKQNVLTLSKLLRDKYKNKYKRIKEFKVPGNTVYIFKMF